MIEPGVRVFAPAPVLKQHLTGAACGVEWSRVASLALQERADFRLAATADRQHAAHGRVGFWVWVLLGYFSATRIEIRRFFCRPSSVELSATAEVS